MSLYTVYSSSEPLPPRTRAKARFHCAKHDQRLPEIEEQHYEMLHYPNNDWFRCNCPGFHHYKYCRHQKIARLFIENKKVDTGHLYDYENQRWTNYFAHLTPVEE